MLQSISPVCMTLGKDPYRVQSVQILVLQYRGKKKRQNIFERLEILNEPHFGFLCWEKKMYMMKGQKETYEDDDESWAIICNFFIAKIYKINLSKSCRAEEKFFASKAMEKNKGVENSGRDIYGSSSLL